MTINHRAKDISVREYAAIHLSVPDSGDAELDAMIRKANCVAFATAAIPGLVSSGRYTHPADLANAAIRHADALLAALEAKP